MDDKRSELEGSGALALDQAATAGGLAVAVFFIFSPNLKQIQI